MFRSLNGVARLVRRRPSIHPLFSGNHSIRTQAFFSTTKFDLPELVLTKACAQRIIKLRETMPDVNLRLSVEGGGCSGFQYNFELDSEDISDDDRVFERDGAALVVDDSSLEFVRGSTIDFTEEMIRSSFIVSNNPNSESACGCGSSFALKQFAENPAID